MKTEESRTPQNKVDNAGALCSTVCAVHCATSVIAPGVLATMGIAALAGPKVEWGFTIAAILFASWALLLAWEKHRNTSLTALFVIGIAGLALGRAFEAFEISSAGPMLSICSGITLVVAHVMAIGIGKRKMALT